MQTTDTVLMSHGSGGTMMRDIIEGLFFDAYAGDVDGSAVTGRSMPSPSSSGRHRRSYNRIAFVPHG